MRKNLVKNKVKLISASAGFPSPAENYVEEKLNLNSYLIKNKESSFFVRVSGDSMINVGIFDNDILIVDRSLDPKRQSIVIVSIDGELVIKKLMKDQSKNYYLKSENSNYPNIKLNSNRDTIIWGVVTYVIHSLS
jgi:DNA polymerase V|tara:strand:+ start:153 stop:557 length:405 start_codon:yes stop_codon:yes gene_type:complete